MGGGLAILIISSTAVFIAIRLGHIAPEKVEVDVVDYELGWREDFTDTVRSGKNILPSNWRLRGKPGTPISVFEVVPGVKDGTGILQVRSDSASGTIVTLAENVDLDATPVLRWRWRVSELPAEADGRVAARDDQAIGIYIGDGSLFNNKSVAYRWDTEAPVNSEGTSVYGLGTVNVKWYTLRNSGDPKGEWFTEKRNFLEDFKEAWGEAPRKVYVGITSNSQYTASTAEAELDWIEFISAEKQK